MKAFFVFVILIVQISSAETNDVTLKLFGGGAVSGHLIECIPAAVKLQTESGVLTILLKDLDLKSKTNLPDMVSFPYKRIIALENGLDNLEYRFEKMHREAIQDQKNLATAIAMVSNIVATTDADRMKLAKTPPDQTGMQILGATAKAVEIKDAYAAMKKWPDRIVLISMAAKTISEQGSMVIVSYKIVIKNGSNDTQRRDINFRFIDGEGFMLEHDLKYNYFLKSGTNIISDTTSMSKKTWAAVKSFDVELVDHY